jgi:hypothetical protein
MVWQAGAVGIADSFGVPGKAHGFQAVVFGVREQGIFPIFDPIPNGLCL